MSGRGIAFEAVEAEAVDRGGHVLIPVGGYREIGEGETAAGAVYVVPL